MKVIKCSAIFMMVACGGGGEDPPSGEPCYQPTVLAATCDPAVATFSLASTNPYYPLKIGSVTILEGQEQEGLIRVERRVLADTEVVSGVTTHVLEAKEFIDNQIFEIARNFYVEASDGTVCYFGEFVEFFENGVVINNDGSWRADDGNAKPGVIMPAGPTVGDAYFQENAPGIAIDMGRVVKTDGTLMVGATMHTGVVTVMDANPLDSCDPTDEEEKLYVRDIGEAGDAGKTVITHTPGS